MSKYFYEKELGIAHPVAHKPEQFYPFPVQPIEADIDFETGTITSSIVLGRASFLSSIASFVNGSVGNRVRNFNWTIVRPPREHFFLTSDNPAIAFGAYKDNKIEVDGIGLGRRNVTLVLPLTPDAALFTEVGALPFDIPEQLSVRQCELINQAIYRGAYRHIFSKKKIPNIKSNYPRLISRAIVEEDRKLRENWASSQAAAEEQHEAWLAARNGTQGSEYQQSIKRVLHSIASSTREKSEFHQMVYESCYWKDDLRSYAKELSDFSTCTTLEDEYRGYRLEKALLLSAFTVRLLLDANKLSDRIGSLNLKVDFYPAKIEAQKNISPLDKRFIDERYFDLASPTSSSISLRQLTNQLIHSAVVVAFSYDNANRALGFFVVSDNDYEKRLCYCSLKEWSSVVEAVADDDVIYALIHKDPKTGKCITVKLAASDLIDIDATLSRLKSKGLSPDILDAIRKNLTRMATEESARPDSAADLNDMTPESLDA